MRHWIGATALAISALAYQTPASADAVSDFYAGKTVTLNIGYSVGGAYDVYARMVTRHIGKHIPGEPTVIAQNMEGAGSLRAANYLYVRAPKDGTSIATFARGGAFYPLLGLEGATFEATKFNWLGSANNEVSVCVAWYTSGINSVQDLIDKGMTVGGTGPSDDTVQFARVMNGVLNTKLKIVTGYPGGGDVVLAVERGELQGRCGWSWSSVKSTHKSWIDEKKIKVLVQLSFNKHKEMPDVPLVTDLAKTDEQRQLLKVIFARQVMGRPYAAPPGTPQDRVAALRKAFMDTMNDPEFLADSDKAQLEINPVSGEEVQKLVSEIYAETAPDVAKKAGELLK